MDKMVDKNLSLLGCVKDNCVRRRISMKLIESNKVLYDSNSKSCVLEA